MPEVVVITGAGAGIGRATARLYARRGASIALIARDRGWLEAAAKEEVADLGGRALVLQADTADAQQIVREPGPGTTTAPPPGGDGAVGQAVARRGDGGPPAPGQSGGRFV